jgi:hypothetical protein
MLAVLVAVFVLVGGLIVFSENLIRTGSAPSTRSTE